jgi:hypothetical protein
MNAGEDQNKIFPLASEAEAPTLRPPMAWKRKIAGGILGVLGFMLSPLSWWNDAVVNLPLALMFAWLVGVFYKPAAEKGSAAFDAMVILGYWITNILGFILMHKGAKQVLSKTDSKYTWRTFSKDLAISLIYTGVIVVLIKLGVLQPIQDYFAKK